MDSAQKNYELPSEMLHGLASSSKPAQRLRTQHPLESIQKTFVAQKDQIDMAVLRKTQGLYAPLVLAMERKCVGAVGHLPFLPRSNASLNSLTGRDLQIGFEDYLGHANEPEFMGQPHAMVEKQLGFL